MLNYIFTTINDPNGTSGTAANGINDAGQVVGLFYPGNGGYQGFLYDNGIYTTLNDPNAGGAAGQGTVAIGINNSGQIVGYYNAADDTAHGFIYNNGTYVTLDDPAATYSYFSGTIVTSSNDNGQFVGYYYDSIGAQHGFTYSNNTFTTLDDPNAVFAHYSGSELFAINNAGEIVGSFRDSNNATHGFLYNNGTFQTLDDPAAATGSDQGTFATGLNDSGQIVGEYRDANNVYHGFLYENGSFTNFDEPDANGHNTQPYSINNHGQIAGSFDTSSATNGFLAVPCYCRGTRILTSVGEVLVEQLCIGDLVITLSGNPRPIRWIGRRGYDGRFINGNRDILPICIKPNAIMTGVPARELWVSPEHSLYIDDVLVQAKHLINGITVVQAERVEAVEYFHLELDSHDVIYADGMPAETFVNCDNRLMFANAVDYAGLYPDDERPRWRFCAPRLEWGAPELVAIREWMFDRAGRRGQMATGDPALHLVVDGIVQLPTEITGKTYRFELTSGCGEVRLGSHGLVPAERDAVCRDVRRLGVPLERIALSDAYLSIEAGHSHPGFRDGFHADETSHRWTDGHARVPHTLLRPFRGPLVLEIYLAATPAERKAAA